MIVHDKLGQEIRPGSFIIYGHALGRCAALRFGKVLKIIPGEGQYHYQEDVVPHFNVIGINDDFGTPKTTSRISRLLFADRIVVLQDNQVPDSFRELLKDYEPEE